MAIRHSITLSTTEPNNEVGVIKIRQADEQTQTLEVQITENGVPKSYQGLAVYFCAKLGQTAGLGIIEQKLNPEEMTNPANGKLEYTMRAEDWQILGRQKGYFSFRKMKGEHEFVEQFTTRDFTFDVIKSVYSDGLKEVKKDGSTYVWTIEDLIRLFNEYMASGKSDWEEFVEQNREVLESVDPGGKLIGELIDARRPFGGEAYATLGERLDSEKAEIGAQLEQKKNSTEHYFPSTNIKAVDGSDGIDAKTIKYNQLIALIDNAVSGVDWITKRTIVRDSSDTYNVYAYDIVPNKYNDYIVADGNMHGDGPTGDPKDVSIALYYFIKDIVENHGKNDKLMTLLNKTNLCIIPVANPWGYDNDSRYTVNGVDINRNFNYNHTPSTVGGLTPFSEKETIGLRDNMRTILKRTKKSNAKVLGYISYHAFGGSHIKYPPEFIQLLSDTTPSLPAFENARQYLLRKYGYVARFSEVDVGTMPSSDNYMERVFGVPSGTAEMIVYRNDGKERSAEAMTQHVEYYGDILYQIVNLNIKPKKKLSVFKASERKTFESNTTSKLKFSPTNTTENYFETDATAENIIVPSYVDYVKIKATVNLFNENTYKNFPIAVYVYINDSLVYSGPTFYESDVSMGSDVANNRKRTHTVNLATPPIFIREGADTKVNVQVYNGNDASIMLGLNLATTWISVEEYDRYN